MRPKRMSLCAGLAVLALLVSGIGHGFTYHVDDDASCPGIGTATEPFCAIKIAISSATDSDEIIVHDGVYLGTQNRNINFLGKAITLRSENGPENCIIDCENASGGFYFNGLDYPAGSDSIVDGFTIMRGNTSGVYCGFGTLPVFRNCIIRDNYSSGLGGGVRVWEGASPTFVNCVISDNSSNSHGAGVLCCWGCSITLLNCTVVNNTVLWGGSDGYGGGIAVEQGSDATIINCVFEGNYAEWCREIWVWCQPSYCPSIANVEHSDIRGGTASPYVVVDSGSVLNWGTNNIDCDPVFAATDDYHLTESSCCIDAGTSSGAPSTDVEGNPRPVDWPGVGGEGIVGAYDIGAYEVQALTPNPPTNPGAAVTTTDSIEWTWADNAFDEEGFNVYAGPGATAPAVASATTIADATAWTYSGLTGNTLYAFQVSAYHAGGESTKSSNCATFTLSNAPSIGNNVSCDKSVGTPYPVGTDFTFSNPAGFGAGTHGGSIYQVSLFKYVWDTTPTYSFTGGETHGWSSHALVLSATTAVEYYLHLQAFNEAAVPNANTLDYGPFSALSVEEWKSY